MKQEEKRFLKGIITKYDLQNWIRSSRPQIVYSDLKSFWDVSFDYPSIEIKENGPLGYHYSSGKIEFTTQTINGIEIDTRRQLIFDDFMTGAFAEELTHYFRHQIFPTESDRSFLPPTFFSRIVEPVEFQALVDSLSNLFYNEGIAKVGFFHIIEKTKTYRKEIPLQIANKGILNFNTEDPELVSKTVNLFEQNPTVAGKIYEHLRNGLSERLFNLGSHVGNLLAQELESTFQGKFPELIKMPYVADKYRSFTLGIFEKIPNFTKVLKDYSELSQRLDFVLTKDFYRKQH